MPFYHDVLHRSDPRDPAEVEFWRRLLDHGPGPLTKPVQTIEEIRARLEKRNERSAHAIALTKAGFGKLALAWLARVAACDVEHGEAHPPSLSGAEFWAGRSESAREHAHPNGAFQTSQTTGHSFVETLQHKKATASISEPISTRDPAQNVDHASLFTVLVAKPVPEPVSAPSLIGLSGADPARIPAPTPRPKRTRRRPPTPRKGRKKPKPERLKTIPLYRHEEAVTAYLMAQALGCPFNVAIDFNPGIDHLDHPARLRFWAALIVNIQSYIRGRCDARGMPYSWWPAVFLGARESKPHNSLGEHLNGMIHVPDDAEFRHLLEHLKKMRKKNDRIWCHDIVAKRADDEQRIDGRKVGSRLDYVLKAAHRDTRAKYPYMIYERSGFITGERLMISKNLTHPKVVASVEKDVAMHRRLREERRSILIAEILRRDAPPRYPWE